MSEDRNIPVLLSETDICELMAACMHGIVAAKNNGGSAGGPIFRELKEYLLKQVSNHDQNKNPALLLSEAIDRIKDLLLQDDAQAYKEARKFLKRMEEGHG